VIHPGVDAGRFSPPPDGRRAPAPTFLYVGRLTRYQGVSLALRALARARGRRHDLTLEVAGAGDYRSELERQAADLGIGAAVRFLGFISEDEKIERLRRAWANVFPSPKEGWGITVIEAAACATPSIASDTPGLRDSVRHGETGYLVPHGDVDALAARMLELADAPDRVATLGSAARRFAEGLTWERAAVDTERHLHDIIAGSGMA
jgi:glycosyltransferase involved in cell wall biosynthesis